jgi:hypothetical protein
MNDEMKTEPVCGEMEGRAWIDARVRGGVLVERALEHSCSVLLESRREERVLDLRVGDATATLMR